MRKKNRSVLVYGRKTTFKSHLAICLTIPVFFLLAGCSVTFEFTEPPGHPARTDIFTAEHHPSEILLKASPVETKPARSTEWDDEEEMHHHDHEHSN